eukprot:COSAG04_NODE_1211_length_7719_cov_2.630232_8_plen_437_part_00
MPQHAYGRDALADVVELNLLLISAYSRSAHGIALPSAITETSQQINSAASWQDRAEHWRLRTLPLAEQTFALLRHPGKVLGRQIFDYNTTSLYHIAPAGGARTPTPEMELMALVGRARGGTRVHANSSAAGDHYLEAVVVDTKLALLLLNSAATALDLQLDIAAGSHQVASAVVLDASSLRPLAIQASDGGWGCELPAQSVAAVTFEQHGQRASAFAKEVVTTEALPPASAIMQLIARNQTTLAIDLKAPAESNAADRVWHTLTVGVRGWLENATMKATIPCDVGDAQTIRWARPGTLAKAPLNASCTPRAEADGVRVSLEWQPPQNLGGATEDAHFVLAVLSTHQEVTLSKTDDDWVAWRCRSDEDCQLAGQCQRSTGVCACDAAWTGVNCSQLALQPAPAQPAFKRATSSSWGGSVVQDRDGLFHMFASEFTDH